jgi:hypothetical protein
MLLSFRRNTHKISYENVRGSFVSPLCSQLRCQLCCKRCCFCRLNCRMRFLERVTHLYRKKGPDGM